MESEDLGIPETDLNGNAQGDPFKTVNIGVVFGFGMGFNATEYLQFGVGLRFDAGFTTEDSDIAAISGFSVDDDGNRSGTIAVTGLIEFSIKYILRTD